MRLKFTKMHGLGNDFVVLDTVSQQVSLTSEQVRFLADRRFGVGCDQVLLVEPPRTAAVDFRYRIFNADGGEVEQCGNGARCFARFVREQGLTEKTEIEVETAAGIIRPRIEADGNVTVDMGKPRFSPEELPLLVDQQGQHYSLRIGADELSFGAVSMGNPHAVFRVDNVDKAPVAAVGPQVESHKMFPRRVNVGFMQVVDRGHIRLRVYERGTGETLACGTGACAAVCIGRSWSLLDERVKVELPGGNLAISWDGKGGAVWMTGPAETVYEGSIEL
ncbi:MAG: diaminopimelate epimerase [Gammaproteobacteria bacterium]|nr:diaminopimelate epimerase [Gammaproteobacteria bacterium]